jgi:hypothetical protein
MLAISLPLALLSVAFVVWTREIMAGPNSAAGYVNPMRFITFKRRDLERAAAGD